MDATRTIMQAAGPVIGLMHQDSHQSHEVPNSSAYSMMRPPVNSDPHHVLVSVCNKHDFCASEDSTLKDYRKFVIAMVSALIKTGKIIMFLVQRIK